MVRDIGALRSLRSKLNVSTDNRHDTDIVQNKEQDIQIEDYVDRETAVATKRDQDADTAIRRVQEDMRNAEMVGSTSKKPEITLEEILNAIGDSLSNLASSNNEEDQEDEDADEQTEQGRLSEDAAPGWVMGAISKTVHHSMESFRQS